MCGASVHPRAGGELFVSVLRTMLTIGSSPRGRGTRAGRVSGSGWRRFIPARAGNSLAKKAESCLTTVHPRAGGELSRRRAGIRPILGSSPRGRGTQQNCARPNPQDRFIPARAGNSRPRSGERGGQPVHPRAGGELTKAVLCTVVVNGSSPRGRGTRLSDRVQSLDTRFIPARAGNSRPRQSLRLGRPVHPRAGGELPSWNLLIQKAIFLVK